MKLSKCLFGNQMDHKISGKTENVKSSRKSLLNSLQTGKLDCKKPVQQNTVQIQGHTIWMKEKMKLKKQHGMIMPQALQWIKSNKPSFLSSSKRF